MATKSIEQEAADLNRAVARVAAAKRNRAPVVQRLFGCELVDIGSGRIEIRKGGVALVTATDRRNAQDLARLFW